MKKILIALALTTIGCGHTVQIDSDFTPIVDEFSKVHPVENLIVEYGTTSKASAGATCYQEAGQTPRIAVDRNTWNQLSSEGRREALRHEMGHCVLGREHTSTHYPDNCPTSIMNPSPTGDWCRNAHGAEYEEELFNE